MENNFYVYEHVRNDNNTCFYVGRGHGRRARSKHRNDLHDEICSKYGYHVLIYKDGLTSDQASKLEQDRINYYVNVLGYGIDISGYGIDGSDHFLTNRSFGGEDGYFDKGELNPQFGNSPKDRMGSHYNEWLDKTRERLCSQVGENNPNFGNDTLKKKLIKNPELKLQYYSRPGAQNGRAKTVKIYDKDHNYINTFSTIGEACEYIKGKTNCESLIDTMRANFSRSIKTGKEYRGFYGEYIN